MKKEKCKKIFSNPKQLEEEDSISIAIKISEMINNKEEDKQRKNM